MSELESWLPPGGANKFQEIKRITDLAEASGNKIYKLSIGQPVGSALAVARVFASLASMMKIESIHEYQDNGAGGVIAFFQSLREAGVSEKIIREEIVGLDNSYPKDLPAFEYAFLRLQYAIDILQKYQARDTGDLIKPCSDFAQEFAQFHTQVDLSFFDLAYLPIPGIKPMLPLIPVACGASMAQAKNSHKLQIATMTNPGYPVPSTWGKYLPYRVHELPLTPENKFRFTADDIPTGTKLLLLNYPHNPSGQIAIAEQLHAICPLCQERGIRIFNDAAYAKLAWGDEYVTLADVAVCYSGLSWCEAYSASKMGANFTGWRVGAMVGSQDFIEDIRTIKGNIDSGFFAPAACGVLAVIRYNPEAVDIYRDIFRERQMWLIGLLTGLGMKPATIPQATFFNIWQIPKKAFGQEVSSAEHFNTLLIEKGDLVGVHFEPYCRYAVVANISELDFQEAIEKAFVRAQVEY